MMFGQRLRQIRKKQKKTQKDLEVATGIPQTTISGWEACKFEPQISDAQKLAIALGVSIAELLDDTVDTKEAG